MTTVGHTLTGLSIGLLCMPRRWSRATKAGLLATFAVLANVPDIRYVPSYEVRHSLLVNLLLLAGPVAAVLAVKGLRRRLGGWPVVAGGAAAWMSHLLLDSFYSHNMGVPVAWPLSDTRLSLAMPWFHTLKYGWAPTARTAGILGVEVLFYGTLLLICLGLRRMAPGRPGGSVHGRTDDV